MKNTHKNALEILKRGGAVAASQWTTGSGRWIRRRPTPQFCREIRAKDVETLEGEPRQAVTQLLNRAPRTMKLIVLTDRDGLETVLKHSFER